MKVKLLRDSRIIHHAGEIVEVSAAEKAFLLSVGSAVEMRETDAPTVETREVKAPVKRTRKKEQ